MNTVIPGHRPDPSSNRHGSAVITMPSDTEILITRIFDAPAALVFDAYTAPELVRQWWGSETSEWVACTVDLRVGGGWRYVIKDGDFEVGFHGEYREIDGPTRLVTTEVYEGVPEPEPGQEVLNVVAFDEVDGVTTLNVLVQAPTLEVRDLILNSGMETGMQVSYDRLEDLVRQAA